MPHQLVKSLGEHERQEKAFFIYFVLHAENSYLLLSPIQTCERTILFNFSTFPPFNLSLARIAHERRDGIVFEEAASGSKAL